MRAISIFLLLSSISAFAATDYQKMMKCFKNLSTEHNTVAMRSQFSISNKETVDCKVLTAEEAANSIIMLGARALGNLDDDIPSTCMVDFGNVEKSLIRYFNSKQVITCTVKEAVLSMNIGNANYYHLNTVIFKAMDSNFEFMHEIMEE